MFGLIIFLLFSIILIWLCRYQLLNPHCHGFYRFFAFEGIVWNLIYAIPLWQQDLFSLQQIVSFILMMLSLVLLIASLRQLKAAGRQAHAEIRENFVFENTASLSTSGIYRYIRHPMYASLLLFSWGILFKRPFVEPLVITLIVTVAIWLAARVEEGENRAFFGQEYDAYCKRSKMILPFIF